MYLQRRDFRASQNKTWYKIRVVFLALDTHPKFIIVRCHWKKADVKCKQLCIIHLMTFIYGHCYSTSFKQIRACVTTYFIQTNTGTQLLTIIFMYLFCAKKKHEMNAHGGCLVHPFCPSYLQTHLIDLIELGIGNVR
jgi:hypothetical protein